MKIRIIKQGLPKAQVGREAENANSVVVNGIRYLQGDPGYEAAKQEVDRMRSQMGNLREVNSTIQDLKGFVPKIRTEVGNVANNSIRETRDFLPKVRPAVSTSMNPFGFLQMMANPAAVQNEFTNMGRTDYSTAVREDQDRKLQQRFPALGPTPREQYLESIGMPITSSDATADPRSFDIGKAARTVSGITDGLQVAGAAVDYFSQDAKLRESDRTNRRNNFDDQALSPMFRGNYNINTGRFRDNVTRKPNEGMFEMGGEQDFANINNMMKIRITSSPQNLEFAYGGQSGFGLDLGRSKMYDDMSESKSDSVSNTIREVPREEANIEAERGETVYGDLDGDGGLEHMKIGGKRHSEGGTPLNVPEGSFIFSDTAKMKIKDPNILKYFGLPAKKGGYTPAEIAKRYDVNKYKAIVDDENSDEMSKNTAQLMLKNYEKKLAYLAMVQESMKGFPQGAPQVAKSFMGDEEGEMAQAKYGGSLPKYQTRGQVTQKRFPVYDEDEQRALQEYIKKKYNVEIPINARDADPERFTLPEVQATRGGRRVYGDEDWTASENMADFAKRQRKFIAENPDWDPTEVGATEKFQRWYDGQRKAKGMNPYFDKGQGFQKTDDKFGEYTFSAPDIEPTTTPVIETPESPIGYICLGLKDDGFPNIQSSSYKDEAARSAAGAYASSQEAALHCPGDNSAGKISTGEKPKEKPPGFFTPDKLTLLNAGLTPPQAYVPSVADLPYRQGDLALEDWLAKAQNRQQGFNIAANTLGQYQAGPALASNLSFLAGQTGEGVAQDIAQVDSRNVDRVNQFTAQELQRRAMNDMYNTSARDRRFEGTATVKQNLDNARRQYTTGITKAANNAFANRMYTDMINKVNPIYNLDPRSGLSFYKPGYGTDQFRSGSNMGGLENFANKKNQYMAAGMSDSFAERRAYDDITGGRTTYTDSNADGIANSVRTNVPGGAMNLPASYNQAFRFMYGGQIGPWTKKKK